jgi:hypothetical protein
MGTKLPIEKIRTYMNFGKLKVTKSLNKELEKGSCLSIWQVMNIFRRWINLQTLRIIKSLK